MEQVFAKSGCTSGTNRRSRSQATTCADRSRGRPMFMVRGVRRVASQRVPQHLHASRRAGVPPGPRHRQGVPCFYHAWSFDTEGELKSACRAGTPTARSSNRRARPAAGWPVSRATAGFVFASFDPEIVDLQSTTWPAPRSTWTWSSTRCGGECRAGNGHQRVRHAAPTGSCWWRTASTATTPQSTHDTYFEYLVVDRHRPAGRCQGATRSRWATATP